jgi:hypothetical protein
VRPPAASFFAAPKKEAKKGAGWALVRPHCRRTGPQAGAAYDSRLARPGGAVFCRNTPPTPGIRRFLPAHGPCGNARGLGPVDHVSAREQVRAFGAWAAGPSFFPIRAGFSLDESVATPVYDMCSGKERIPPPLRVLPLGRGRAGWSRAGGQIVMLCGCLYSERSDKAGECGGCTGRYPLPPSGYSPLAGGESVLCKLKCATRWRPSTSSGLGPDQLPSCQGGVPRRGGVVAFAPFSKTSSQTGQTPRGLPGFVHQNSMYRCAKGSTSAGSQVSSSPSARTS